MKIVYQQGKHKRTVHVDTSYVAKAIALLQTMKYRVLSVKTRES